MRAPGGADRRVARWLRRGLLLVVAASLGLLLWGYSRNHPEDVPWTQLDLARPVGAATSGKIARLDAAECRALLRRAGIGFKTLPPAGRDECRADDLVRLRGGAVTIAYRPSDLATSCKVAAALALWEWHVVQPAALRHFGVGVASIDHFGSYSCRRPYGRSTGAWSEHARANALDIAAFRLTDGRRISVASDWADPGGRSRFLRDVRDGACRIFATTLSPDYNRAHRDHLHLDEAGRGRFGSRACR
ncbi:MAG TPA: extensin family protein [Allosphingosinicella sp.]|nr:extensin family protein [Allosphingosinicella sp.]